MNPSPYDRRTEMSSCRLIARWKLWRARRELRRWLKVISRQQVKAGDALWRERTWWGGSRWRVTRLADHLMQEYWLPEEAAWIEDDDEAA